MKATLGGVLGKIPRPTPAMAVALLALLIAASGAAVAAIPSGNGTITACRDTRTGTLRVIDAASQTCNASKESQLTWINGLPGSTVDKAANAANAANADKLDNKDSTDFYAAGSKVADSELLDGKSADDLTRVAVMNTTDTLEVPRDGEPVTYGRQLSITAPANGFVRISGNVTVRNFGCSSVCYFDARVRHIESASDSVPAEETALSPSTLSSSGNAGLDAVFPVNAGVNTFDIRLKRFSPADGTLFGWYGVLTAEYTPYGSTGAGPQSASAEQ